MESRGARTTVNLAETPIGQMATKGRSLWHRSGLDKQCNKAEGERKNEAAEIPTIRENRTAVCVSNVALTTLRQRRAEMKQEEETNREFELARRSWKGRKGSYER